MKFVFFLILTVLLVSCSATENQKNQLLVINQNYDQAIANYKLKITNNKLNHTAYYNLAQVYLLIKQFDLAEQAIKSALVIQPLNSKYLFLRGKINYYRKDYFLAITQLQSSVRMNYSNLESYYYLGKSYFNIGKVQQAKSTLQQALEIEPHYFPFVYLQVYIAFHSYSSTNLATEKEYLTWIQSMDKAIKLLPTDVRGYVLLADIYQAYGNTPSAMHILHTGIDKVPTTDKDQLYLKLANIHFQQGESQKAVQYIQSIQHQSAEVATLALEFTVSQHPDDNALTLVDKLIQTYPKDYNPLLLKGKIYLLQNKTKEAIQIFNSILLNNAKIAEAHFLLAKAYNRQEKVSNAIFHIQEALKVNPNNLHYHLFLIEQYLHHNQLIKAKNYLNALAIEKTSSTFFLLQAQLAKKEKNYQQANTFLQQASKIGFSLAQEREAVAVAMLNGNLQLAKNKLNLLNKLGDSSIKTKILNAKLLYLQNNKKQATSILQPLVRSDVNSLQAMIVLAMIYTEKNQFASAIQILAKAWQTQPYNPIISLQLINYYEWTKQYQKAIQVLGKLQTLQKTTIQNEIVFKQALYLKRLHQTQKSQRLLAQYNKSLLYSTL